MAFKGSERGPISGRISIGETDSDTRSKRSNKRAEVSILPARRTIINVYQLVGKLAEKKGKGQKARITGEKKSPFEEGQKAKATGPRGSRFFINKPDAQVYVKDLDGEPVNIYNFPVYKMGEDTALYNSRAHGFAVKYKKAHPESHIFDEYFKPSSGKTASKKEAAVEEEVIRMHKRAEGLKASELERELLKKQHEKDPLWKLWRSVQKNKVPTITARSQLDPRYSYTEHSDPTDDYEIINRAIEEGKLLPKDQPPLVIAQQSSQHKPPLTYFIRSVTLRRQKSSRSIMKRPIVKSASRTSKKRKVVMKRKGGKK